MHAHAGAQVKYSSLPNYEEKEEDFRAESVLLRRRFTEEGEQFLHLILNLFLAEVVSHALDLGEA